MCSELEVPAARVHWFVTSFVAGATPSYRLVASAIPMTVDRARARVEPLTGLDRARMYPLDTCFGTR